jgi:hypothetical protein
MNSESSVLRAELNGIPVAMLSVTAAEVAERVRRGLLAVDARQFGERVGAITAQTDFRRDGDHSARVRLIEADLRARRGIPRPLVWHATGAATSIGEVDLSAVLMTTNLGTSAEHEAILNVFAAKDSAVELDGVSFPVTVYPPLSESEAERVRIALSETRERDDDFSVKLADQFVRVCDPQLQERIELVQSHVATRSPKITSKTQIDNAIKVGWRFGQDPASELDASAEFLAQFMKALGGVRPELAPARSAVRTKIRPLSLSTGALAMNAYIAVASHLYRRDGEWHDAHRDVLLRSPLSRTNRIEDTIEAARKREVELRVSLSPTEARRGALGRDCGIAIEKFVGGQLEAVGYSRSLDPSCDFVLDGDEERSALDLKVFAPEAAEPPMTEREFDASLEAASRLVLAIIRGNSGPVDFFDIDAPWWVIGRCVGYRMREGGNAVQRRQAKNAIAKRWAGQLAVRVLSEV